MNCSEHSEHTGLLHPVELDPKIVLCEHSAEIELWFELFGRRKQRELSSLCAERMHRQRVQRQLHSAAFNQLPSEFSLWRVLFSEFFQVKATLASCLVINDPKIFITDLWLLRFLSREDQINPATNSQRRILIDLD